MDIIKRAVAAGECRNRLVGGIHEGDADDALAQVLDHIHVDYSAFCASCFVGFSGNPGQGFVR